MRPIATLVCTLVLLTTAALAEEEPGKGDVQVLAHVGARVYVDDHLAGVSLGEELRLAATRATDWRRVR